MLKQHIIDALTEIEGLLERSEIERAKLAQLVNSHDMSNIQLKGPHGELETSLSAWCSFLQLARDHEWEAGNTFSLYQVGLPLHVSAAQANRMADALQSALETVSELPNSKKHGVQEFASDISDLISFCRAGCFDIHTDTYGRRVMTSRTGSDRGGDGPSNA